MQLANFNAPQDIFLNSVHRNRRAFSNLKDQAIPRPEEENSKGSPMNPTSKDGRRHDQTPGGLCSQLSAAALRDLQAIMLDVEYPEDSLLFDEDQALKGVFVLKSGMVKLTVTSEEGKTLILRLVRPGEVIGLSAAISGSPYESCAIAVHRCEIGFIRIDDLSRFLASHIEVYEAISKDLIAQQSDAWKQLRMVGLCSSVSGRLARLLIEWSVGGQQTSQGIRMRVPLTHEEIGEFIGTTRETVSRTLGEFKNRHLVALHGSTLTISNLAGLERIGAA
jgi:CRP/FNR family transcriptional regulator